MTWSLWKSVADGRILQAMKSHASRSVLAVALLLPAGVALGADAPQSTAPAYASDGKMLFPVRYREWVYLSSGFNMSYSPTAPVGHDRFDNVFVTPEAYRAFVATGTWPDKTVLVLELRGAESSGSINKSGSYQGAARMGVEVHVKDVSRFKDGWAFFGFSGSAPAEKIATSRDCYACHEEHAAVDRTFVQFYPTLLPIAMEKGTVSATYLDENKK